MRPSKFKTIACIIDITELKTAFTLPRKSLNAVRHEINSAPKEFQRSGKLALL